MIFVRGYETAPVRGDEAGAILGETARGRPRDVQPPADHIRFAAADQFCTVSSFLWKRSCGLRG